MRCRATPCPGFGRRLHSVANVLAVAESGLANDLFALAQHRIAVTAVRTRLLAADIVLHRAVDCAADCDLRSAIRRRRRLECRLRFCQRQPLFPIGRQIFIQSLAAAFTAKTAFAVTAESGAGIEQVGRIDPDDAGLDTRGHIECEIDVLRPDRCGEPVLRVLLARAMASSGCGRWSPWRLDRRFRLRILSTRVRHR